MVKLYVLYILVGAYAFWEQIGVWLFFSGDMIASIAFYSSILLFLFASILSLFKVRIAAIIGLVCLIGEAPFATYWIFSSTYSYVKDQDWIFHLILGITIILYLIAIFYSLKIIVNYKKVIKTTALKKPVRLLLALMPVILTLLMLCLMIFNP